ncbi:hypothetical protein R0J90_24320, partial [Micrococcus sp. SIMBA_144]
EAALSPTSDPGPAARWTAACTARVRGPSSAGGLSRDRLPEAEAPAVLSAAPVLSVELLAAGDVGADEAAVVVDDA